MNCLPTPLQTLLLQAALYPPERALDAWKKYLEKVDLKTIDHLSGTFLPLVYRNLNEHGVCKSVYRHTWTYNNLQFFKLKKTLEILHGASIETCLLKGAGMVAGYYLDPGLRVMGDIDLLVPREKIKQAIDLMRSSGWTILDYIPNGNLDTFIQRTHALSLKSSEGLLLDLHWVVLSESGIDEFFAKYTYKTKPHGDTNVLCPEDQLLHTLFHGMKYGLPPLIRWIPDAFYILKNTPRFDWTYLFSQAKQLKIELAIHTALDYLHQNGFVQIPARQYIPTPKEKRHFAFITGKKKLFYIFQLYWHTHLRHSPSNHWLVLLLNLPRFVMKTKRLTHFYELIPFFFKGLAIHSRKIFK